MTLAVTLGDPRGIGPEVMLQALSEFFAGAPDIRALVLGAEESLPGAEEPVPDLPPDRVDLRPVGRFTGGLRAAGRVSAAAIRQGVEAIREGEARALVTGPVHKPALRAAGVDAPGQTEWLQELTGAPSVGMLMHARTTRVGPRPLRILLATTHLPLRDVAAALTAEVLEAQVELLDRELKGRWGIRQPAIGLCGLNPHASDGGLFGDEEERIMSPAVDRLRGRGIALQGPLPADTIFLQAVEGDLDAVVAPYHDVGMAVFKTLTFGRGVNTTLGLPFPRTSPDHGTAFGLAGTGRADAGSALEALRLATELAAAGAPTDPPRGL
ncbi:MAG: 4-hydroxythreonine-4-phosphate dehydrogenase PdxA [bacterium]